MLSPNNQCLLVLAFDVFYQHSTHIAADLFLYLYLSLPYYDYFSGLRNLALASYLCWTGNVIVRYEVLNFRMDSNL